MHHWRGEHRLLLEQLVSPSEKFIMFENNEKKEREKEIVSNIKVYPER